MFFLVFAWIWFLRFQPSAAKTAVFCAVEKSRVFPCCPAIFVSFFFFARRACELIEPFYPQVASAFPVQLLKKVDSWLNSTCYFRHVMCALRVRWNPAVHAIGGCKG